MVVMLLFEIRLNKIKFYQLVDSHNSNVIIRRTAESLCRTRREKISILLRALMH